MSSTRRPYLIALTLGATLAAALGYAIYFDHRRRNDTEFRKRLRKQQKRVYRTSALKQENTDLSSERIREALMTLKAESLPKNAIEQEQFFQESISRAENLVMQGEKEHFNAAVAFFRALRVYPSPMELIMVYQRMVPEPVLKIIMELYSFEVSPAFSNAASAAGSVSSNASHQQTSSSSNRSGPPSEASSQEWENLTDPGRTTA